MRKISNHLAFKSMFPELRKKSLIQFQISAVVQPYETDVFKGNVIRGNDLLLKCVFPSHVSDLVVVTAWVDSEGSTYANRGEYGNYRDRK